MRTICRATARTSSPRWRSQLGKFGYYESFFIYNHINQRRISTGFFFIGRNLRWEKEKKKSVYFLLIDTLFYTCLIIKFSSRVFARIVAQIARQDTCYDPVGSVGNFRRFLSADRRMFYPWHVVDFSVGICVGPCVKFGNVLREWPGMRWTVNWADDWAGLALITGVLLFIEDNIFFKYVLRNTSVSFLIWYFSGTNRNCFPEIAVKTWSFFIFNKFWTVSTKKIVVSSRFLRIP